MTEKISFNQKFLRTSALTVALLGAVGSLILMFNAGRNQKSVLLIALFTTWVFSPFAGLSLLDKMSSRWTAVTRASLYWLMIVLTIGSLVAYSSPPETQPASIFLVVPAASWLLIVAIFLVGKRMSSKSIDTNQT